MSKWFNIRCTILCFFIVAGFSVLSWRLIDLQLVNGTTHRAKVSTSKERTTYMIATRGYIADCNDELIARSISTGKLIVDKNHLFDYTITSKAVAWEKLLSDPATSGLVGKAQSNKFTQIKNAIIKQNDEKKINDDYLTLAISHIAPLLQVKKEEMRARILENEKEKSFVIKNNLTENESDALQMVIDDNKLVGFTIEKTYRRQYASPELASHLIGYPILTEVKYGNKSFRKENGVFGAEKSLEKLLAGTDGYRISKTSSNGLLIAEPVSTKPPRAGLNVQLTMDLEIQRIIQEELDKGIKQFNAQRGGIIVMNPKTGAIMGMASYPTFNLNDLSNLDKAGANFCINSVYEPGSTFKSLGMSAAIDDKKISRETPIFCHDGLLMIGKYAFKDHSAFGTLTAEWILGKSSNIGIYKCVTRMKSGTYFDYLDKFGIGKKSYVSLSGEQSGSYKKTDNPTEFSSLTYGYGVQVTPLQIANAYCAIAGDGNLRRPQILKAVIANDGTVIDKVQPEIIHQVIRPETAKSMRQALTTVTSKGGTALLANVPGFKVGAKTGTAKKIKVGELYDITDAQGNKILDENGKPKQKRRPGTYYKNRHICSLAGMLPALDPAFVCVVVIDDPLTTSVAHGGGTIAAPIFSQASARIAEYLRLTPTEPLLPTIVHE